MGVTGLWTVVAPTARPTQLATLNRKRLAVDASIWIYQFLKAVRDKEGNALRNSHVIGFFRRICKLLYFGIKPVFVFDGGAPVLKRETVRSRARRREGRREDAARTAGKLLAVQVARAAEEEEKRRREQRERTPIEDELPPDQELVYVDEIGMNQKERQAGRGFKRKDQYHLPDLDTSIESMGAPNDPRIMSQPELEEYARQFHSGEDINLYDFSKIDFESPFFLSLPAGDRYNILNAARLRSRLRMGYSKEQLDGMFPDRMAFSRFQIERVKERNELTQRLMHINGMSEDFLDQGGRIAGEKGKEYILVKNDGVEGGWALGVVSNKQGSGVDTAIDVDKELKSESEELSDDDDDFEDVEIEGLNRLPKLWKRKHKDVDYDPTYGDAIEEIARKRRAVYDARASKVDEYRTRPNKVTDTPNDDADTLFVPETAPDDELEELFEDVNIEPPEQDDDDDLQQAIAMSLQQPDLVTTGDAGGFLVEELPDMSEKSQTSRRPFEDENAFDLQAALAESRKSKHQSQTSPRPTSPVRSQPKNTFDGPLPFESLNLGQSLLGKKKAKKVEEGMSGGFDRDLGEDAFRKERPPQPMPAWFDAIPTANDARGASKNDDDEEATIEYNAYNPRRTGEPMKLGREQTREFVDLEADEPLEKPLMIEIEDENSEDESVGSETGAIQVNDVSEDAEESGRKAKEETERNERYRMAQEIADKDDASQDVRMDEVAEEAQADPPPPSEKPNFQPALRPDKPDFSQESDEEGVYWSESEAGEDQAAIQVRAFRDKEPISEAESDDEATEFEDVSSHTQFAVPRVFQQEITTDLDREALSAQYLIAEPEQAETQQLDPQGRPEDDPYMSDSEEELMRQLAVEAEEHARFASSLTSKTPVEAARDYENELKQLRNQQKKDRRDADEVTQVMVQECQALLRLFGLPYITAPMEAEAQCAELVHLGLVDGIVTDDSDIFLFGGTRIYKNMFNAAKFVECYLATDLEKEYALDRRKLIRFAHLLGSDYTEGIPGIGPVSALEILTDFANLEEFKEWCAKVQLGRPQDLENQLTTPFRRKFKNTVQKRLFLPPGFPDVRVDAAYLKPDVDSDPQEFQWGVPDLDKLRSFLMATIGWNQERTDEILVPVIRDMNKRGEEGTQANITRFFAGGVGVGAAKEGNAPRNRTGKESGRMVNAFKRLRGEARRKRVVGEDESEEMSEDATEVAPEKQERKSRKSGSKRTTTNAVDDAGEVGDENETRPPKTQKRRNRKDTALE